MFVFGHFANMLAKLLIFLVKMPTYWHKQAIPILGKGCRNIIPCQTLLLYWECPVLGMLEYGYNKGYLSHNGNSAIYCHGIYLKADFDSI